MDSRQHISSLTTFLMPNLEETVSIFPDNGLNPHYEGVRSESRLWINRFNKSICGSGKNCKFELINAFCYPYADKDGLRATMDLANLTWLYDEYTDTKNGQDVNKAAIITQKSLHDSEFDDGSWLCRMTKEFKANHIDRTGPIASRFIDHFCVYLTHVVREAELRESSEVLDIRGYISMRRETSGVRCCFDLVEHCLGVNLPQEVYNDPVFISGYDATMDLIYLANDLYSYNMEQGKGHSGANIITVFMKTKKIDLQAAMDFLGGYFEALIGQWYTARTVRANEVRSKLQLRDKRTLCIDKYLTKYAVSYSYGPHQ
ncbi:isoprenoid synthase domain-containing protein [Rhodocollybia butyracea]|uniref:Terpene synthase n=1 Tax=Rhodocollybia butyracea TaxID=206335 RepID=A0A9P5U5I8_9AGAR|nr:isoprenoid synthase domain-containing protein [Rhodocollybia butyracea]